jgi:hypothetical protein
MKIGSEYKIKKIEKSHWEDCAKEMGLKPKIMLEQIESMVDRMPAALDRAAQHLHGKGLTHPLINELVTMIKANSQERLGR